MHLRGFRVVPPRIELGTQGFSVLCSTNWAMAPSIFPYLKFGEVPFFSFGITKVGIFSYTPNFSDTFFNIFLMFFRNITLTHYPSENYPETLFLTFFRWFRPIKTTRENILCNIDSDTQPHWQTQQTTDSYFISSSRTQRTVPLPELSRESWPVFSQIRPWPRPCL